MRGYKNKILILIVFVILGLVVIKFDIPGNIGRKFQQINGSGYLADATCTSGAGKTYFVRGTNVQIRNGASSTAGSVGTITSCTMVTVYCQSNGFGKVSKSSDKWIAMTYLSESKPTACSATPTTTTNLVSFRLGAAKTTPAPTFDQMYADKNGTIEFDVTNITNLAIDENNEFSIRVSYNSSDVTNHFEITKSQIQNGTMHVTLKMINGTYTYSAGSYTITVSAGKATAQTTKFDLVQKYYEFMIQYELTTDYDGVPVNRPNTWQIDIERDGIPENNNTGFTLKVLQGTTDYTSKFDVKLVGNRYTLTNKTNPRSSRPLPGTYTVEISYYNASLSNARGTIKKTFEIELGNRVITFEQEDLISHRYIRTKKQETYTIDIISTSVSGGTTYINFAEIDDRGQSTNYRLSEAEFKTTYSDFPLESVRFYNNKVMYYYNETLKVINFRNGTFTYLDTANRQQTMTEEQLRSQYPEAYTAFTTDYTVDTATGDLKFHRSGSKVVDNKQLSTEIKEILASSGGEYTYTIKTKDLLDEDYALAKYTIYKMNGDAKDQVMTESMGFYFSWTHTDSSATILIKYDNILESYEGSYYILIEFPEAEVQRLDFSIYGGDIDFYLTSQVDQHLGSLHPLDGQQPPGNQRYEYYLGFYLMRAGKILNYKSASNITVSIYDHYVDFDEQGHLYYYDQVDYEVTIKKYLNNRVTYELNGETHEESLEEFSKLYKTVANELSSYTYGEDGTLTQDNNQIHVVKFFHDESIPDMVVEFYTTDPNTTTKMPLTDFKVTYREMYGKVVTRFVYDTEGNIILGKIRGSYRVKEKDGVAIAGNNLTQMFDITVDYDNPEEIEKAITVLPKTEVNAGTYYVYVSYDQLPGVGYVNNGADAVINRYEYPEMWEQNIHMTTIAYTDPEYSIGLSEPTLTNTGNNLPKMYYNRDSSATFAIDLGYIYDFNGISYNIEYDNQGTWVSAQDKFNIENLVSDEENPRVILNNIIGKVTSGKYRLTVNYTNKGKSCSDSKEFEVSGKYYGLRITSGANTQFMRNYSRESLITVRTEFAANPSNIVPTITRYVDGLNDEKLVLSGSSFQNAKGEAVFNFHVETEPLDGNPDVVYYYFHLTNVKNVTPLGDYTLTFTYEEAGNEPTSVELPFRVTADEYYFTVDSHTSNAGATSTTMTFNMSTQYIDQDDLRLFTFTIFYYDTSLKEYIDVSSNSEDVKTRMFILSNTWGQYDNVGYPGQILATLTDNVDWNGDYYLRVDYRDKYTEYKIPNLQTLFSWDFEDVVISATYQETVTADGGDTTVQNVALDKFYSNIKKTKIDITIKTVHENPISWTINKDCLEESCDPTAGTNYDSYFDATNLTGRGNTISLVLKDDMQLEPGTYALTLYYTSTDYKVYELVVYDKYVKIAFDDSQIYSHDAKNAVIDGLYRNLQGFVSIPVVVNGIEYKDVVIKVTDINGLVNYDSYFLYNSEEFIKNHTLDFTYNVNENILTQPYMITAEYATTAGVISDSLIINMNDDYFDFTVNEPQYTPNPIYPNAVDGGHIDFQIDTINIPNLIVGTDGKENSSKKHYFAGMTIVRNSNNNDVTSNFRIEALNLDSQDPNSFILRLAFDSYAVEPGQYTASVSYGENTRIVTKTQTFIIGDYIKTLELRGITMVTQNSDGRIHRNIGGTYRIRYVSSFDIQSDYLKVKVLSPEQIDVTKAFNITVYDDHIDAELVAQDPYLASGTYTFEVTYQELSSQVPFVTTIEGELAGTYTDIVIDNMDASATVIYSDREDQKYTFELLQEGLSEEQIRSLKARVYDIDNALVYSEIAEDNKNTGMFGINNKALTDDGLFEIEILPFKAQPDTYSIELCLADENGEYSCSNKLLFDIHKKYYRAVLDLDSVVEPKTVYGNDTKSVYDVDVSQGNILFTSNYPNYEDFTVKIIEKGTVIHELEIDVRQLQQNGVNYLSSIFDIPALEADSYELVLCIKGLEYSNLIFEVKKYVPVTDLKVLIDGKEVGEEYYLYVGQKPKITFQYEPENATNPYFDVTVESDFMSVEDNIIDVKKEGHGKLTVKNKDIQVDTNIIVEDRIKSNVYTIDYDEYTIFVSKMNTNSLARDTFIKNLIGLADDYKILDKNGSDVTKTTQVIGTGYVISNNSLKYTVIVIGDLTGDGRINIGDVSMLYQHLIGTNPMKSEYSIKAGHVRKQGAINVGDISMLYQFVVGSRKEL